MSTGWRWIWSALLASLLSSSARAGRPLITDDSGVVGAGVLQLETWIYLDSNYVELPAALAFGPSEWLELSLGGVQGLEFDSQRYAARGPIVQLKALLRAPDEWPGLALGSGVSTPLGIGHLDPVGWDGYAYAASTLTVLSGLLTCHLNLGIALIEDEERTHYAWTGGAAVEVSLSATIAAFAELYRGDLYDARGSALTLQGGMYWSVSELVQLDATVGATIPTDDSGADTVPWLTLGTKIAGEIM